MARKTLDDLRRNPAHATMKDVLAVLRAAGWDVREGTRHGTIVRKGERTLLVPRPHGPYLLPVYVRKIVRMLEEDA